MTIRNKEAYFASQWDWACLDGCFGETRISPTDVDGLVERRGHILVMEAKLPGVQVTTGQRITLDVLSKKPGVSVLIVWGKPGQPERIRFMGNNGERDWNEANIDTLREIVSKWFEHANNAPLS